MPKSDWNQTMEKLEFRHVDMFDLFLKFFEGIFSVNSILSYRLSRWVVEEKVMPIIATWFVIFRASSQSRTQDVRYSKLVKISWNYNYCLSDFYWWIYPVLLAKELYSKFVFVCLLALHLMQISKVVLSQY